MMKILLDHEFVEFAYTLDSFLNKLKLNCYEIEDISYSLNNAYIYILCCHENENLLYVLREDN